MPWICRQIDALLQQDSGQEHYRLLRRACGLGEQTLVASYAGRLVPEKGSAER